MFPAPCAAWKHKNVIAHFIFLDPPYRMEKVYAQVLQLLSQSPLLAPDAVVVAEHDKRFDPGDSVFLPCGVIANWSRGTPS